MRRFPLWTLLAVALVAALVVGSGVLSSSPPTRAQRARAIESVLRCPSCEDLSVADSTAPTAQAVRATVDRLVAQGRTDQQIESYLVARYGSTIVLDPPGRGWPLIVWLMPLVGGGVAVALLVTFLYRRRAATSAGAGDEVAPAGAARGPLEERRRFLLSSLADADAEYLAGDLSETDYLALRRRDLVRLRAVDAELGDVAVTARPVLTSPGPDSPTPEPGAGVVTQPSRQESAGEEPAGEEPAGEEPAGEEPAGEEPADRQPADPAVPPRSARRRWLLRGATLSFAAALVVAVSLFASNRQPGQSETGTVSMTQSQQIAQTLDQAAKLENQGQLGQAAQLYQSVLTGHPDNEVALAQLGWLEYRTGRSGSSSSLMEDAERKLERATSLDPGDYAASLYLGTVLFQRDGNAGGAVGQYQRFLADDPPATLVAQAAPDLRQAYQQAGVPLPPQLDG